MRFLVEFLSITALLASGISAVPLHNHGMIEARVQDTGTDKEKAPASTSKSANLPDFEINKVLIEWMGDPKTQKRLKTACNTVGGWESWAQLELEGEFRSFFQLSEDQDIREPYVYDKLPEDKAEQKADFLILENAKNKGMIIELKCENKKKNLGTAMGNLVADDKGKHHKLKAQYKGYTFTLLAMAWTTKAEAAITSLGLKPIEGAKAVIKEYGTMKVYREDLQNSGDIEGKVDEVTEALANLSTADTTKDTTKDTAKGIAKGNSKDTTSKATKGKNKNTKEGTGAAGGA